MHNSGGRPRAVTNDDSSAKDESQYIQVHVCINCGYLHRREDVDSRQVASGLFRCLKCYLDGPLNVETRDAAELNDELPIDNCADRSIGRVDR